MRSAAERARFGLLFVQLLLLVGRCVPSPTLACLMIVRDERHNLLNNLPLWPVNFFDAYVIAVDDRTQDDTLQVLERVIPQHVPRHVFNYTFEGFGPSR